MNSRVQMLIMLTGLLAVTGTTCQPAQAERDNNKRQLAVVVPVVPTATSTAIKSTAITIKTKTAEIEQAVRIPDFKVTPEMQKAFAESAKTAGDVGRVVFHRAADVAQWMSAVWKKIDTVPTITPAGGPHTAEASVGPMRPLEDWGPHQKLYYTNERRLKTVTDR